jgi:Phosphatidylglycerol lysyltransferase, C-terminal
VAAGDPIGPQEEMLTIIQQFMAFCQEQDWRVVSWQVREVQVDLYRTAGLHVTTLVEVVAAGTSACGRGNPLAPQLSGYATRLSHRIAPGLCGGRSQVGRFAQKPAPF